jgi:hypothetical protein
MYTLLWSLLLMAALISASVLYHHDRDKNLYCAERNRLSDASWKLIITYQFLTGATQPEIQTTTTRE